ncbi:MAG: MBL fold metallo-hydrolase [Chloroflexi bacterium]|nr:MBL fold metallo-hydrolase [Chloroflexota bacterium]
MELTCWGATCNVTGSMHLLVTAGRQVLLDCGLFQGSWNEAFERNRTLPFSVNDLHAVVLSHTHLDHCGNLPSLVKAGYTGPIYCTPATRDLTAIMLRDAAHIQEADAEYINLRHRKKNESPDAKPLYTQADAERVNRQLLAVPYGTWVALGNYTRFMFLDAGHILGSAIVLFQTEEGNGTRQFCFSGDLGRSRPRILREREFVEEMDYLLIESTYGDRLHDPVDQMQGELAEVITEAVNRSARVLIPAFAIGRTQELVYILHGLQQQGVIPDIPVFVDSPLAVDATEVYRVHAECYNDEMRRLIFNHEDPFGLKRLNYVREREASVAINQVKGPCIIIAGSGMCEGGRIRHHLTQSIEEAKNTILIVSYQAVNTLGRRLADRQSKVKIFGEEYKRRARVKILNGFSAHADSTELLEWVTAGTRKLKSH